MPYLYAFVALVGAISALNLVLTLGIVRRLRVDAETGTGRPTRESHLAAPGSTVAESSATDVDERVVSRGELVDRSLVGFFSPGCTSCAESVPGFLESVAADHVDRSRALAYPAFFLLNGEGTVLASGCTPAELVAVASG